MRLQLQLAWLILTQGALIQAVTLVAKVSSGGVKAHVSFTQNSPGQNVDVTFDIGGPSGAQVASYQLHTYRLNYDGGNDRCSEAHLGPRLVNNVAAAPSNISLPGYELSGIHSLEGRSIAFHKVIETEAFACATLELAEDYNTAVATFRQKVLGHMIIRQVTSSQEALTRVTASLHFDGSENAAKEVEWRVVEGDQGCADVKDAYDPKKASGTCDSSNHNNCAIGDLTRKLGKVSVSVTRGPGRKTWVDLNLPLTGSNGVADKTVQLFLSGESKPLACASIRKFTTRTGITTFDNEGVTGTITMRQRSPLDPTTVRLDLKNLKSQAGGYHVHKWPVPQRVDKAQLVCSGPSVSGHFNPFGIDYKVTAPPSPGTSTEDLYEAGDLSGVFGTLGGKNDVMETFTDFNLQLFGTNSVIGRSIVIHKDLSGTPRWICANIQDTVASTYALATFTYPVIGHVLLRQREGDPLAETAVYVSLDYGDGSTAQTTNHRLAVHSNPVNGDNVTDPDVSTRCASAGDVYNPAAVRSSEYSAQCLPSNPLRCKLGDLSNKLTKVYVRSDAATPARTFFTDINLPIQGPNSVLKKAIVLRGPGDSEQVLACANIMKVWPLSSVAQLRNKGKATFSQQIGVVLEPTTFKMEFKNLPEVAATDYRVTNTPVGMSAENTCPDATQPEKVYNPFEATTSGTTKDFKAVGELSAKFGAVNGSSPGLTNQDYNLDLWGPRGITGRSLTLTSSGASLDCANVEYSTTDGSGKMFKAIATFAEGPVSGQIHMTQYLSPDGSMSPTTVIVDLRMKTDNKTKRHNWHTHEKLVGDDANANTGRCSSTGGHYNPFKVNTKTNYDECSMTNPLRCELGDQANKLGTYDMGSGPMVFTDVFLPLAGQFGVIGRSFVVHVADRGAPRLACADIMPTNKSFAVNINTEISDRSALRTQVATYLNTDVYNTVVAWLQDEQSAVGDGKSCREASVYFLGMDADQLKTTFSNMIKDDPDGMSICRAAVNVTSLIVVLVSACIGRLLSQ